MNDPGKSFKKVTLGVPRTQTNFFHCLMILIFLNALHIPLLTYLIDHELKQVQKI